MFPELPPLPDPTSIGSLPLWKAEKWLDDLDADDQTRPRHRAWVLAAATAELARVNDDEVARVLESRHAELRLAAILELGRRGVTP